MYLYVDITADDEKNDDGLWHWWFNEYWTPMMSLVGDILMSYHGCWVSKVSC